MYLALDIGAKRIGVAVGTVLAFGRGAIEVTSDASVLEALRELIQAETITHVIVGLPLVKSGDVTDSQARALAWAEKLKEAFGLPVTLVDETLSSREAERQLREERFDTAAYKAKVDERSAMIILQQYLDQL